MDAAKREQLHALQRELFEEHKQTKAHEWFFVYTRSRNRDPLIAICRCGSVEPLVHVVQRAEAEPLRPELFHALICYPVLNRNDECRCDRECCAKVPA